METLAHFEILELIGRGGMGEVYKARDTKLRREVALKFLPENLAADPERFARFQREAHVLASLNHPNIASIYGLEEEDGRHFLVMELAEGEDLAERIARGPIPEEEVLEIAMQIAAGLEEAHENGVIHRDLKPANIKVSEDGKVKILDFGLARALAGETAAEESPLSSPTITAAMTQGGVILGTAAYMSPEQARGKKVDRRADIWAFGVILYEMYSGKRLFEGETISDTLAAVLRADPDWSALPVSTSPGMRRLMERCLDRDPLRRLRDVGEARIFLEDGAQDTSVLALSTSVILDAPAVDASKRGLPAWLTAVGGVVLALAGVLFGWQVLGKPEAPPLWNMALVHPADAVFHLPPGNPAPIALSPDGAMAVFGAREEAGDPSLYLRRLKSPDATSISGTEGASYPFWSPDGRYIGFHAEDKLKKVSVAGGPPVTLCAASNMKGGTWNQFGDILFAPDHQSGIHRVSDAGGEPVEITTLPEDGSENSHRHPRFLPDGKHFLFLGRIPNAPAGEHRIYLGSLDGDEPKLLTTSQVPAEYSAGNLLTVREGILLATPFDPGSGELGEDGIPLVEDLLIISAGAAAGNYSSTLNGTLAYQIALGSTERSLEWTGPPGTPAGQVGEPGELFRPRISPDGTQAAVEILNSETDATDLWLVDLENGLRSRFTFEPGNAHNAVWTPDGRDVLYVAEVDSIDQIVRRPVEGTGGGRVLFESSSDIEVSCVSPDGRLAYFHEQHPENDWDIHVLDLETGETSPVLVGEPAEAVAMISPDGRWMAYLQETPSSVAVYVRPASGGDRRWQVDRAGGVYPFWSPDGSALYYVEFSGEVVRVPVVGSGDTFRTGALETYARVGIPGPNGRGVSLHPDGKRLLHAGGSTGENESGHLQLVTDWRRGLTK